MHQAANFRVAVGSEGAAKVGSPLGEHLLVSTPAQIHPIQSSYLPENMRQLEWFYSQFTGEKIEAQESGVTSPGCSLQTWCPPTRDSCWGAFLPNLKTSMDYAIREW